MPDAAKVPPAPRASPRWGVATALPGDVALADVPALCRAIQDCGIDVLHVPESVHDSFLVALLALQSTTTLRVRTSLTVALPRSPMVTALAAWDLVEVSGGRFELGLGSQVRGNIVDRYSSQWSDPAAQMRDYFHAVRAIFAAFERRTGLTYEGPYYRFTRLQPLFTPRDHGYGPPRLVAGGVGPRMCRVAGEVADEFVAHPTASHPEVVRQQILPRLTEGVLAAGRQDRPGITVVPWCLTGIDHAAIESERARIRRELSVLFSTPAYHRTLTLLGHPDVGAQLHALSRERRWSELAEAMPATLVADLVPEGTYDQIARILTTRYDGLCDTVALPLPPALVSAPQQPPTHILDGFASAIAELHRQVASGPA
ncbi:putative F420-dependent oxidoreductase [Branchiibius hedensis]|uniref:Probable F420-dependent oxidoreductase, MSMEG_2256 family n=1 Tax=Branchiibius hedensis TaxID=672460 RepID=A0A2Y8ZUZ0_9MICO|nr:TIGR03617 family F420-dependent LLM class oxidoreductase [Branchiibius hedensis]PWJ27053.1 putative F420-dependent oxidoreductase [Branchiibius hedensis]SSA35864.1 probable F420-dependent oxidoreductase, MSMEG_2256 family [Branchiibius hedensis]